MVWIHHWTGNAASPFFKSLTQFVVRTGGWSDVKKRQVVNQLFSRRIWLRSSAGSLLSFLLGRTVSGWLLTGSSAGDYHYTHARMSWLQVCSYFSSSAFVAVETFWLWLVSCVLTGEKWVTILTERLKLGQGLKKINRDVATRFTGGKLEKGINAPASTVSVSFYSNTFFKAF